MVTASLSMLSLGGVNLGPVTSPSQSYTRTVRCTFTLTSRPNMSLGCGWKLESPTWRKPLQVERKYGNHTEKHQLGCELGVVNVPGSFLWMVKMIQVSGITAPPIMQLCGVMLSIIANINAHVIRQDGMKR